MKKTFIKSISSILAAALSCGSLAISAGAEVILRKDEVTFLKSVTPAECIEYKIYNNHFLITPSDTLDSFTGTKAFLADPTAKDCIEYNIWPNKYNIVSPHYVTGNLITENNGYYKYLSDDGYSAGTIEIKPNTYPCKKGVCYDTVKKIDDDSYNYYLILPLDAEDIPKAEAFIESDDREGLYDFLADINAYEDPYFGSQNTFTSVVNRDYTPVNENSIWAVNNYTQDEIYQQVIDRFVYPYFGLQPNPTSGDASDSKYELDFELNIGDANMDNKVSLTDIIMINKMSIGSIAPLNSIQRYLADVDGSMVIDAEDVSLIMQYILGIIEDFPNMN